jgi:hypothetical protein
MRTKRTKRTGILPQFSNWPDVSQICASRGRREKPRPSTRPMQFVLTPRSAWLSLRIGRLGGAGPSRRRCLHRFRLARRAPFPLCYPHSDGLIAWVEMPRSAECGSVDAWRFLETARPSLGRAKMVGKIADDQFFGQQSRHGDAGLSSPRKTGETKSWPRSHDRRSDSETGGCSIARVPAAALPPQSSSASANPVLRLLVLDHPLPAVQQKYQKAAPFLDLLLARRNNDKA